MQVEMQNEKNEPDHQRHHHYHSDMEIVGSDSGRINRKGGNRSAIFNIPETSNDIGSTVSDGDIVEITLDVSDDSVAVQTVRTVSRADVEDPEVAILAKGSGKKSTLGSSVVSSRIKQVTQELKRLPGPSHHVKFDRTNVAATHALKGLKFISTTVGGAGWIVVEALFNEYTKDTNGLLPRSLFGEFIKEAEVLANKIKENKGPIELPIIKKKESEELPNKNEKKESDEFALGLFDALARRLHIKGGLIDKSQLRDFWEQMSNENFDSRLHLFLDMVDKDADGRITKEEIREIITLSASANKLSNVKEQADQCAALFLEALDPNNFGYIMIKDLEMFMLQAPGNSVRTDESKNYSKMLSRKFKPRQELNPLRRWYQELKYFLLDNWERVWVMALWIGVMVGLFTYKYVQYKNKAAYEVMGVCVCLAKGAAETLKLNMALILLPVCRNTITWLRNNTKLGVAVPFDNNLDFHKIIAIAVAIGVGIHGISHLACDFPRLLRASPEKYELMEPFFGDQPTSYWHFVKGVEGVTGIIMVVLMAIAFMAASLLFRTKKAEGKGKGKGKETETESTKPQNKLTGFYLAEKEKLVKFYLPIKKKLTGYNAFWYSHHLFVIVYALLIVHGIKLYLTHEWYKKTTWMYISIPVTLYASERLIRAFRSSVKSVRILKVVVYKANVLTLHMSKPQGFRYKSGQYMFVKCAKVSPFEWHPFSITSAPGDDYLSVHIRNVGDWTGELKNVFSKACEPSPNDKSGLLRAEYLEGENNPKVLIDGPYGAPAQDYQKYEVVLLIGLGIGATPMISIVKDIVNNMRAKEKEANAIEDGTSNSRLPSSASTSGSRNGTNFKTQKAYFYWVTREADSFEWFKGVMNEVAELERNDVIEMHNYCSSMYEEDDARSTLITMLQSLNHAKKGIDIVSGTRVKSHFAKPNWHDVFKRIAMNHTNSSKIGVFYCGLPQGAKEIKQQALNFTRTSSTKFDFHKENF